MSSSALRPHPCSSAFNQVRGLTFLQHPSLWATGEIPYEGKIANVEVVDDDGTHIVHVPRVLTADAVDHLLEQASKSVVGKGDKTELDEEVRSSSEIHGEDIKLDDAFVEKVNSMLPNLAESLAHPYLVKAKFYKMVIYKPGDHFHTHMDAPHIKNMVMTLSIEIPTFKPRKGGDLQPRREDVFMEEDADAEVKTSATAPLKYSIFYHDVPHEVTELESGYKVSLIFDVVETDALSPKVLNRFRPQLTEGVNLIRASGMFKLGFQTNHVYMASGDEEVDVAVSLGKKLESKVGSDLGGITLGFLAGTRLKGIDRVASILLREMGAQVSLIEVLQEGDAIFHAKLLPIMQLSESFGSLYHEQESSRDDDEEDASTERPSKDSYCNRLLAIKGHYDPEETYVAIKDDYLLGDVVFVPSAGESKLQYKGSDEIHLGNGSFYGTIWSNLAIIATLPQ